MFVRVAEEVEGVDASLGIKIRDDGVRVRDPDELCASFGGLFLDPSGVGLVVLFTTLDVTIFFD